MSIKITSTMNTSTNVKMLVYSRAGIGKTVLCSTAPKPLILSAESGLLSLRHFDLPVIEISDVSDVYDAYEFITESKDAEQYETICLDSITEIAEVLLLAHKKEHKDPRQSYTKLADDMAVLIRGFRDLPNKHVYFSAKQTRITDESTGVTTYQAMMPGRTLTNGISFFFDEVACLRIGVEDDGEEFRYLQCQPDVNYEAKDRSGELGMIEKPDLSYIFKQCLSTK